MPVFLSKITLFGKICLYTIIGMVSFGALQACGLRLAIAAFATGALLVDALVERAVAIERHTHLPAQFPIEVLDTAFLFDKLRLVAGLPRGVGKEQGAAKALGEVAIGVRKLVGGMHAKAFDAQRHAVGITTALGMTVLVECNGSDATAMHHGLVGVPGIKGGIGSDVGGKEAQCRHGADVEGNKGGDIVLVKGLGVLGQDHIAIAGHDGRGHTAAIAPEQFLALLFGAIGLLLIDAFFDAQPTIGIAFGLLIFLEAFADIGAPVVFFDPGVD